MPMGGIVFAAVQAILLSHVKHNISDIWYKRGTKSTEHEKPNACSDEVKVPSSPPDLKVSGSAMRFLGIEVRGVFYVKKTNFIGL